MCRKYKVLKNLFLLCVVFYCACLLFVRQTKASLETSFEQTEDPPYVQTTINLQNGWTSVATGTITSQDFYSGYQSLYFDNTNSSSGVITKNFATSTSGIQCVAIKYHLAPSGNENLISLQSNTGANNGYILLVGNDLYVQNGNSSNIDSGHNIVLSEWNYFCINYNTGANQTSYILNGATTTNYSLTNTESVSKIYMNRGYHYNTDGNYSWTDSFSDNPDLEENQISINELSWWFPQDGYELNNSEWNDWGLYYNLSEADLGKWNLLMVFYTDSQGKTTNDWEIVSSTTNLTYWTLNRSRLLPDGEVSSQAKIVKIDNCENYWNDNCVWEDIAETEIIYWTASSTGYTIFDNPYDLPGFTPASTTASSTEEAGWVGQIWNRMKNVFPLSIGFQLQNTIKNIAVAGNSETQLNIPLNSILPSVMASQIATSVTLISSSTLTTGLPFYGTTIYPTFEYIIYGIFILLIIYILWPRAKQATT